MHSDRDPLETDQPTEIAALRSLASALADSSEAYETAAREGEELFRPIFLTRAKERKEMVNELNARIRALGGEIEGETDDPHGFASAMHQTLLTNKSVLDTVDDNEAKLRSLFSAAINQQYGDTESLLRTHFFALERGEGEMRSLREEGNSRPR